NELGETTNTSTIELTSRPTANVTVTLQPSTQVTFTPSSLVFTPSTWNIRQTATIRAVNDAVAEGYHEAVVRQVASSSDLMYEGVTSASSGDFWDEAAQTVVRNVGWRDENTPVTLTVLANDIDQQGYQL